MKSLEFLLFQVIAVHCGINNLPRDSVEKLLEQFERLYGDIKELNLF